MEVKPWPYGEGTRTIPHCPFCDSNAGVIENKDGVTAWCRRCRKRFDVNEKQDKAKEAELE